MKNIKRFTIVFVTLITIFIVAIYFYNNSYIKKGTLPDIALKINNYGEKIIKRGEVDKFTSYIIKSKDDYFLIKKQGHVFDENYIVNKSDLKIYYLTGSNDGLFGVNVDASSKSYNLSENNISFMANKYGEVVFNYPSIKESDMEGFGFESYLKYKIRYTEFK